MFISVKIPIAIRTPEEFKRMKSKVVEIKILFSQALKTSYLYPRTVSEEQLVYLLKRLLNPSHDVDVTM